jgi:endonuclease/exonuclease/phosphatase family metal-dependent hydrolase
MTYNIGNNSENNFATFTKVVRDETPDIIVFNEASWFDNEPNTLKKLSLELKLPYFYFAKSSKSVNHTALFSKYLLKDLTTVNGLQNSGIIANIETKIGNISIAGVHLAPETENTRMCEITSIINELKKHELSVIMGDLNSISPGNVVTGKKFSKIKRLPCQYDVIEFIKKNDFYDTATITQNEQVATVPITRDNNFEYYNLRLDYIFLSKKLSNNKIDYQVIVNKETSESSDHYPVIASIL